MPAPHDLLPPLAHAGHGNPDWTDSVLHYLTEPVHLAGLLAVGAVLALGGWAAARRRDRTGRAGE